MSATCTLPIPPSANHIWKMSRGKQYRSEEYVNWIEAAQWLLHRDLKKVDGIVRVTITIYGGKGFPVNRDLDNCIKPAVDALRKSGVIRDDNVQHVREVVARYIHPLSKKTEANMTVSVEVPA